MSRRNACEDLVAGTVDCKHSSAIITHPNSVFLTEPSSFMAASKVLGEESVKEQAQQQGGGQK